MFARSFRTRLLVLLLVVLALLQAGTLISVHFAGQPALRRAVSEELRVGSNVLERVLATRERQLADNLRAMASDFAFREAIATDDTPTIVSVLNNHGERINTDAVILVDLDGTVRTDTLGERLASRPFPFPALLTAAQQRGEASATVSFSDRPYQFVLVPVLAPRPIAWVCAGFEITQTVLEDVKRLTSVDVSLWSSTAGEKPLMISTLAPEQRADVLAMMPALSGGLAPETTIAMDDEDYRTLFVPLATGDGSRVNTLLQRSVADARKPFDDLQMQIITLSTLALIAAFIAAFVFSRTVTRPLRTVAEGAARIERGDYVSRIDVAAKDEIGQLATAFNAMQAAIAAREDQIVHQASHDALTGLPNRAHFLDRLAHEIAEAKEKGAAVGMVMMDVDRFKEINDTLGHQFGDQLLIEIGRRLTQTLPRPEAVARLGGDEFAVRFTAPSTGLSEDVTRRITAAFDAPFVLGDVSIDVDASLGIALFPEHAPDAETLMKRADIAMYDAKKTRKGSAVYEAGRDEHSLRRLALMMELRQAIARDELELHFQPKVEFSSERAVHAEALVRWKHAVHGIMRPDEFIPLAEQSGNIGLITKWVLRRAIAQCAGWNADGFDLAIAVNLSALDLFDSELPTYISGLLAESGLPPTKLVLEITESAVMSDPAYALKILRELKQRGVSLAIDDFGTGYSSLAHLKRLPVDELKIDKSFVRHLQATTGDDAVIVRSTIELGHNMGLVVVAEGVETVASWDVLRSFGCDLAQGYLLSRPLPAAEFAEWVRNAALSRTST
jgi:diguanylate cyclase (GGDEF)-like protein